MKIKFERKSELEQGNGNAVVVMSVERLSELIQDCYMFSSVDALKELKEFFPSEVSEAFDKYLTDNVPENLKKYSIEEIHKILKINK